VALDHGDVVPLVCLGDIAEPTARLLAQRRRLVRLEPREATTASLAERRIEPFDLLAQGDRAAAALRLAVEHPGAMRAIVLLGPTAIARDGTPADGADAALLGRLAEIALPSLAIFGTRDAAAPPEAARHYRARIPACNLMFVYDASAAMTAERPDAVAALILDFLERHDLFLVRRESDQIYP
jgi:pimeloyl-ACP methyl ester carboxylesterase